MICILVVVNGRARSPFGAGARVDVGMLPPPNRGWHRVRPEHSCWPWHKSEWESHQIKSFLASILRPAGRAKRLVLLFKRTCLSQAGRPTCEHSLLRRGMLSCVPCVAFLGSWKENHTTEPSQRQLASACPQLPL